MEQLWSSLHEYKYLLTIADKCNSGLNNFIQIKNLLHLFELKKKPSQMNNFCVVYDFLAKNIW